MADELVTFQCNGCQEIFQGDPEDEDLNCPKCGSVDIDMVEED